MPIQPGECRIHLCLATPAINTAVPAAVTINHRLFARFIRPAATHAADQRARLDLVYDLSRTDSQYSYDL
jgi:hypothetical protein